MKIFLTKYNIKKNNQKTVAQKKNLSLFYIFNNIKKFGK